MDSGVARISCPVGLRGTSATVAVSGGVAANTSYYAVGATYPVTNAKGEFVLSTDPTLLDLNVIHDFLTNCYWAKGISRETVARSIEVSVWISTSSSITVTPLCTIL